MKYLKNTFCSILKLIIFQMPNKYDNAIKELESIITPFDEMIGYKPMRNKAKNIIEIYGEEEYKHRFNTMVTFNQIGDIRSDQEKHRLVSLAIENAIHYYRNKRANEQFNFVNYGKLPNVELSILSKLITFLGALLVVILSFLIYNNYSTVIMRITPLQWFIVGCTILFFVLNLFLHKVNDKWLAVLLVPFALLLQAALKYLGVPL